MTHPNDSQARQRALNTMQSFIVQAPAGSGKTELLTQRFLALLATVEQPEAIIALTFTRKAAHEMQQRIMNALQYAAENKTPPTTAHQKQTWQLAQQALQHSKKLNWDILSSPNRLGIQTIDSLCSYLIRHMPLLSNCGVQPEICEHADNDYAQAVNQYIRCTQTTDAHYPALKQLLLHLDNDYQRFESLCCAMLAKRDQWLPYILTQDTTTALRQRLEAGLQHSILTAMRHLQQAMPAALKIQLAELTQHAAHQVLTSDSPIAHCQEMSAFPAAEADKLNQWQGIAELLLNQKHQWRKRLDKNLGFPPGDAKKSQMRELLASLAHDDYLRHCWQELRLCPPPHYSEAQWQIIHALTQILPQLSAELKLIFTQQQTIDFIEVATLARLALGNMESPSDIALHLDQKIHHLLVDEFQDTAISQHQLLSQLIADWQPGDGRSLFLVGDPMQSIYRFRKAEVGLFLRAQHDGLGSIPLTQLTLTRNFRSTPYIVDWVNAVFEGAFPQVEDIGSGAIRYTPAIAHRENTTDTVVRIHPCHDTIGEAQQIVEQLQICRAEQAEASIGILVRSRSHLLYLLPQLEQANIDYQAVDLAPLNQASISKDLYALTRALLDPADRLAWCSVLRAPWCGLTLQDFTTLLAPFPNRCVADLITDTTLVSALSAEGQQRLAKVAQVYQWSTQRLRRIPLANLIEQAWLKLEGPLCLTAEEDQLQVRKFWQLLRTQARADTINNWQAFDRALTRCFVVNDPKQANPIQIMTMHKAKGLEFDIVILPGLSRHTAVTESPLLLWQERPDERGNNDLLLAPIKPVSEKRDSVYEYLRYLEKNKAQLETARLLYVAMTRARKQLHLFAELTEANEGEFSPPTNGSLLATIWPQIRSMDFTLPTAEKIRAQPESVAKKLQRLPHIVFKRTSLHKSPKGSTEKNHIKPWQPAYATHVGTVIHAQLQLLAETGLAAWSDTRVRSQQLHWRTQLLRLGVITEHLPTALQTIEQALIHVLSDPRAQWIFASEHQQTKNEYALTTRINQRIQSLIIDRTFITTAGTRWVIDYKSTAAPEAVDLEIFFQQEQQKYQQQLKRYAQALAAIETYPIRVGLYYPCFRGWHEFSLS